MMASLLPSSAAAQSRTSEFLPTVKCSNCNAPVPLAELGDHVCSAVPATPSLPKPSFNTAQAASLLPQRLQNLVTTFGSSSSSQSSPVSAGPRSRSPPSDRRFLDSPRDARGRSASNAALDRQPPTPRVVDTKSGGEAGMAGVGRRNFAASAGLEPYQPASRQRDIDSSGRRPYKLDLDTGATPTPPLSDSSGSSNHSPGPVSPYPQSERINVPIRGQSPMTRQFANSSTSPRDRYGSNTRDASLPRSRQQDKDLPPRRAPSPDSESEYGGLAYDSDDSLMEKTLNRINSPKSPESPPSKFRYADDRRDVSREADRDRGRDDRGRDRERDKDREPAPRSPPTSYKLTDASQNLSVPSHRRGTSGSGLGLGSVTMAGTKVSPTQNTRKRSSTLSPPVSPRNLPPEYDSKSDRQRGARSNDTDGSSARTDKKPAKKVKVCVRCEKRIEDGKWIAMENSSVLCERCWKNLYLPKCRRCNLPIEKQAVSSSDGQLKGKYHRECFNCHVCNEPFPDKSFYVFNGKPLCAYHYHEKNESLCASASCGDPIEGPCAVSHTGFRFHPEHMLCEYQGRPRCKERLDEYWEIDGLMLCERHAGMTGQVGGNGREDKSSKSKAIKRRTQFIDLTGGGGSKGERPPMPAFGARPQQRR